MILDNYATHKHKNVKIWLAKHPRFHLHFTPTSSSWLNLVYFSIIQRKALSPNDFTDLDLVEQRLTRFEIRYNEAAKPFKWKFTTTDLADLLDRLDRHQQAQTTNTAQPKAA